MKYIGVDYGTKKVGIALSDESGRLAFPHSVVPNERALEAVANLSEAEGVEHVVLGESIDFSGAPNPVMAPIAAFEEALRKRGLATHLEPEHYTTAEAGRTDERAETRDAQAAAIILQSFLDKQQA